MERDEFELDRYELADYRDITNDEADALAREHGFDSYDDMKYAESEGQDRDSEINHS